MKHLFIKHKSYINIIAIIVSIILLATIIVNLVALFGVGNMLSQNVVVDIVSSIIMAIVIVVLLLAIFHSSYKLNESSFSCMIMSFISIYTINYEDILAIKTNRKNTILVVYVKVDNGGDITIEDTNKEAKIYSILLKGQDVMNFVDHIKKYQPNILFEIVD